MLTILLLSIAAYALLYAITNRTSSGRAFKSFCGNEGDFGSPKGVNTVADPYGNLRKPFLESLAGKIDRPGPVYSGQTVAPMTEQEQASLNKVNQYANQAKGTTFNAAKGEIEKTLGGQYDPSTSPYYQAVKAQSAANLEDTKRQIASDAAGAGRYFTGSRIKQQARATGESNRNLDLILGTLAENERQNRLNIIPQALALSQAEEQFPLQQAAALQTYGSLPRTLEQAKLDAQLENFYKSQYEYPLSILQLIAGVQAPPVYQAKGPSAAQNATQSAMNLAGTLGAAALLGCWVAAEVLADGDMNNAKVCAVRHFIANDAPKWFRNLYYAHGGSFAQKIKNRPLIKMALRPLFEIFALISNGRAVAHV